jgi:integrase
MSVYWAKDKQGNLKSPYLQYDFKIKVKGGDTQRFYGSTGQKTKQAAQRVEAKLKELAALGQLSSTMTISEACWKYWDEVAGAQRSAKDHATILEHLCTYFGKDTRLVDVTADIIAEAAVKRARVPVVRPQGNGKKKELKAAKKKGDEIWMPSPATVNRQIIEPIKRILIRAKRVWKLPIDLDDFDWAKLAYSEAAERTRELSIEEEQRLWDCLRADYHPLVELYLISGRRLSDWIGLKKSHVDRTAGTARFPTRKRKEIGEINVQFTPTELEIINQEWAKSPQSCEYIFTYIVQQSRTDAKKRKLKGERHPITISGFREVTDAAFVEAKLENFRRHDLRHTFASRFGRSGGDLKALQNAMDHQDISSTARYRHVTTGELIELKSRVKTAATNKRSKDSASGGVIQFPSERKAS